MLRVSFDTNMFFADPTSWHPVASYATHPDYTGHISGSDAHDLGVLILADPVALAPTALAPQGLLDRHGAGGQLRDASFVNVGYGQDENLHFTGRREGSTSSFVALLDAWLFTSQNNNLGNGGTCYDDSGGPTLYFDGTVEYIVAVTSWGDAVCIATNNNYRTDTASSLGFIEGMISSNP